MVDGSLDFRKLIPTFDFQEGSLKIHLTLQSGFSAKFFT